MLHQKYKDGDVRVLIIDVNEDLSIAKPWADGHKLTFSVLLDTIGEVSTSFAPKGILPELPRDQVPIGSNLLIDREGRIQFYSLLDTKNFDVKIVALRSKLQSLLDAEKKDAPADSGSSETGAVHLTPPELVTVQRGESQPATISFTVKDGFHVLADAGNDKFLVPLRIEFDADPAITAVELTYSESERLAFPGSKNVLGVYSGKVSTSVTLLAASEAETGQRSLKGKLVFQSCNERTCFPPDSLKLSIPIMIE